MFEAKYNAGKMGLKLRTVRKCRFKNKPGIIAVYIQSISFLSELRKVLSPRDAEKYGESIARLESGLKSEHNRVLRNCEDLEREWEIVDKQMADFDELMGIIGVVY